MITTRGLGHGNGTRREASSVVWTDLAEQQHDMIQRLMQQLIAESNYWNGTLLRQTHEVYRRQTLAEEAVLFPALLQFQGRQVVANLEQDHTTALRTFLQLEGWASGPAEDLHNALEMLNSDLLTHFDVEEEFLFPLLYSCSTAKENQILTSRFASALLRRPH